MTDAELLDETCEIVRSDACISGKNIAVDLQPGLFIPHIGGQAPAVACDMPTYVARIDRDGKTLLERVDVTVEMVEGRSLAGAVRPACGDAAAAPDGARACFRRWPARPGSPRSSRQTSV